FATNPKTHALQVALNGTDGARVDETPFGLGPDRPGAPHIPADGARSILYLTIRVEPDHWIQPEQSALLDGAGGVPLTIPAGVPAEETSPGNLLFRARVEHDPLLNHPDLLQLVAALLAVRDGDGRPAGGRAARCRTSTFFSRCSARTRRRTPWSGAIRRSPTGGCSTRSCDGARASAARRSRRARW